MYVVTQDTGEDMSPKMCLHKHLNNEAILLALKQMDRFFNLLFRRELIAFEPNCMLKLDINLQQEVSRLGPILC